MERTKCVTEQFKRSGVKIHEKKKYFLEIKIKYVHIIKKH